MVIKYCPNCVNSPYTKNILMEVCPNCGTNLETEVVYKESALKKRMILSDSSLITEKSHDDHTEENDSEEKYELDFQNRNTSDLVGIDDSSRINNRNKNVYPRSSNRISGRVINYKCSSDEGGQYRRSFFRKLIDYILYGQKSEDVLHRFRVHIGQADSFGYTRAKDIPVNVHGSISNGLSIDNNSDVEIKGKYNANRIFMAKEIYIVNYGSKTKVNFRHDSRFISDFIYMMIAVVFVVITAANYKGGFFDGIGKFFKTWIVMLIIFSILYLFLFAKLLFLSVIMGNKKTSISGVVFLSFIATLVYMNRAAIWNSTGSVIMSFLQSVISTIIFGAIVIYIIKALIGF